MAQPKANAIQLSEVKSKHNLKGYYEKNINYKK